MKAVQTLCGEYLEDDIYNIDETGLFWKLAPTSGLYTESIPSVKKNKSRITVALCTSSTGTDRLPPWFIGHAKKPRALRHVNTEALGGVWRVSKKAWINALLMREWLAAFYAHIGARSVLLLMDNFPAHIKGVELLPPPGNIRIQWLPLNSISIYQPLD